jgi:PucR C-terminal helix-turn-helix domain
MSDASSTRPDAEGSEATGRVIEWLRQLHPTSRWDGLSHLSPDSKSIAIGRLGQSTSDWASELTQLNAEHVIATMAVFGGGRPANESLRAAVESVVNVILYTLCGFTIESTPPPEALLNVKRDVERGISPEQIRRAIQLTHADLTAAIYAAANQWGSVDRLVEQLQWIAGVMFTTFDELAQEVMLAYQFEQGMWTRSSEAVRRDVVTRFLDGEIGVGEASRKLDYRIVGQHQVAVIVWPTARTQGRDLTKHALHALRQIGCLSAVSTQMPFGRVWAWGSSLTLDDVHTDLITPVDDIFLAVASAGTGAQGFRVAHAQAAHAMRILVSRSPLEGGLVHFDEVAVAALMSHDMQALRRFVLHELGELAGDAEYLADLRESLLEYLNTERSLVKTATRIHVARNTVPYRIRRATEILGRPVGTDHLSLHTALFIVQTFGMAALRDES